MALAWGYPSNPLGLAQWPGAQSHLLRLYYCAIQSTRFCLRCSQIFFRCQNQHIVYDIERILMSVNGVHISSIELNGEEWFTISTEQYYRLDLSTLVRSSIKKHKQLFPTPTVTITGSQALLSFLTFYLLAEKRKSSHE